MVSQEQSSVFFCAIGGSGMMPLALMMKARGADVRGSDRSYDQGRTPERFEALKAAGIILFPQDGSGVTDDVAQVIVSTAVEETVPDYKAAKEKDIPVRHRAELLSDLFNEAPTRIAIAGTSGKSTTTGMIGWMLHDCGLNPSVVNGAVMKNFRTPEAPFASALVGSPDTFVAEVDESDGSIALFNPSIAVLNNIALDHKSMDELRALFGAFAGKAQKVILNLDNEETAALADQMPPESLLTFSRTDERAMLLSSHVIYHPDSARFHVTYRPTGETIIATINIPGGHNISNALAALGACIAAGVPLGHAVQSLARFTGIARRLDLVGKTAEDIIVIDDFAHNPDKIRATLECLHLFPGRLLILFQPHGYGPLRLMREDFAKVFAKDLAPHDKLYMCDPLYLGGTTNKSVGSADLCAAIESLGHEALYKPNREDCATAIVAEAQPRDRIVIMGARDDTLPLLAKDVLARVSSVK